MTDPTPSFAGARVFLVEDEPLVAMLMADMLAEVGCTVTEIASRMEDAETAAAAGGFDIAILDVNIAGRPVFPLAEVLAGRRVPIVFASGAGGTDLPPAFADALILEKPCTLDQLASVLRQALGKDRAPAP